MEIPLTTAKLFKVGNSQALRIPARYRIDAREVEVFQREGELVLRPKPSTAAELFARARRLAGDISGWERPEQSAIKPAKEMLP